MRWANIKERKSKKLNKVIDTEKGFNFPLYTYTHDVF